MSTDLLREFTECTRVNSISKLVEDSFSKSVFEIYIWSFLVILGLFFGLIFDPLGAFR